MKSLRIATMLLVVGMANAGWAGPVFSDGVASRSVGNDTSQLVAYNDVAASLMSPTGATLGASIYAAPMATVTTSATTVPEPPVWLLMGIGVLALALRARRR